MSNSMPAEFGIVARFYDLPCCKHASGMGLWDFLALMESEKIEFAL